MPSKMTSKDDFLKEITTLLSSKGESQTILKNIQEAISISKKAKELFYLDGSSCEKEEKLFASSSDMVSFSSKSISLNLKSDTINIYAGYFRNSNTAQTGCGIIACDGDIPLFSLGAYYSEVETLAEVELKSILLSLKISSGLVSSTEAKINIFSFAEYPIQAITVWAHTWKKNGWRKKGGAIKNLKTIQESFDLYNIISKRINLSIVPYKKNKPKASDTEAVVSSLSEFEKNMLFKAKNIGEEVVSQKIRIGNIKFL